MIELVTHPVRIKAIQHNSGLYTSFHLACGEATSKCNPKKKMRIRKKNLKKKWGKEGIRKGLNIHLHQ
jgi:hypothetical protein